MAVTPSRPQSAMQVPLLDLRPQYQPLAKEIQAAIERVCASQHFILGPAVRELEASVAAYCQCRHGIGVSSGTDALLLALMALLQPEPCRGGGVSRAPVRAAWGRAHP